MLVSAKEMLQKAKAGHYAVGQFNINNLEWTKAILLTAQENNLSLIHISEPTRRTPISYAVFCLKKKKTNKNETIKIKKS